ncbi:hypothetical protein GUJ93_ZPchr0015g6773 [Zizania palustris]|uniref:Uncharacterized protein n=1 Tax=Zizania palustris TaxID=103762 RepID=A0A8J5TLM5_ZIZPA|nr:hypothetical protein GUJ93_ZPchr0015g6773 [Zizania palustris]
MAFVMHSLENLMEEGGCRCDVEVARVLHHAIDHHPRSPMGACAYLGVDGGKCQGIPWKATVVMRVATVGAAQGGHDGGHVGGHIGGHTWRLLRGLCEATAAEPHGAATTGAHAWWRCGAGRSSCSKKE